MLMVLILIQGWLVGIAIAAPIGPIGLLCIRKTLEMGLRGALMVGIGSAVADAMFGAIAGFGLTVVSNFLFEQIFYFKLLGGSFLIFLGTKEYFSKIPLRGTIHLTKKAAIPIIATTFFLTTTNPITILSIFALFTAVSGNNFSDHQVIFMVAGIFLGSMSWWLILGSIVHSTRDHVPDKVINGIRKGIAIFLVILGIYAVLSAFKLI